MSAMSRKPDSDRQKADVNSVLASLGLGDSEPEVLEALNKTDLLAEEEREQLANRLRRDQRPGIMLSAKTGEGCSDLLATLDSCLASQALCVELHLPLQAGAELAWLYAHAEVIERHDTIAGIDLRLRLSPADAARFFRRYPDLGSIWQEFLRDEDLKVQAEPSVQLQQARRNMRPAVTNATDHRPWLPVASRPVISMIKRLQRSERGSLRLPATIQGLAARRRGQREAGAVSRQ